MKYIRNIETKKVVRTSNRRAEKKVNQSGSKFVYTQKTDWLLQSSEQEEKNKEK